MYVAMSKEVGFLKVRTLVSLKSGSSEIVQFLGRREGVFYHSC